MNIKKSEWWPTVIVYCRMDIGFIEPENTEIPLCCCFCNWYVSKIHRYHILYENNKPVHVPESYFNSQYKPWHKMIRYIISNLEDSYLIIFLSLLFFFLTNEVHAMACWRLGSYALITCRISLNYQMVGYMYIYVTLFHLHPCIKTRIKSKFQIKSLR